MNSKIKKILSSAEITAFWRSQEPGVSGDSLSAYMSGKGGEDLANLFKKNIYPLGERHLSIRNRFFMSRALKLLRSKRFEFDSCISLGSGLSLLTIYLAKEVNREITFFDVDLPAMIEIRKKRLANIEDKIPFSYPGQIKNIGIDIEKASLRGEPFIKLFPGAARPVFLLEGVSYYLSKACIQWIFDGLADYEISALIFDYWPDDASSKSEVFRRTMDFFKDSINEKVQLLISQEKLDHLLGAKKLLEDVEVGDVESEFVDQPILGNIDEIIPARFALVLHSK